MRGTECTLFVGQRVAARCDQGLLAAEYALFDPGEVILTGNPSSGQGVREEGYLTTAELAAERLYRLGVSTLLARAAYSALVAQHLETASILSFSREVTSQMGPYEAFQGGTYDARNGAYSGAWLDLHALAAANPLHNAATLFQALHLLLVVEEVPPSTSVRLVMSPPRRVGERTWRRVNLDDAPRVPSTLRLMKRVTTHARPTSALAVREVRERLLVDLRSRAAIAAAHQPRLEALARGLAGSSKEFLVRMSPPPTADPVAAMAELRTHTELLRGEGHLRAVAEFLTAMVGATGPAPELTMLAARAWLATGEHGYGRHLARRIVKDVEASDDLRIAALELLESTPETHLSMFPPPVTATAPAAPSDAAPLAGAASTTTPQPIEPSRVVFVSPEPRAYPGASLPPMAPEPERNVAEVMAAAGVIPGHRVEIVDVPVHRAELVDSFNAPGEPRAPRSDADSHRTGQAPADTDGSGSRYRRIPVGRPEIVESLSLPEDATEEMLPLGVIPRLPLEARIAMTRHARELGRDYRLWYGTTLRTNAPSIELMQRHLRRLGAPTSQQDPKRLEHELMRHGALLSEILARSLDGIWADLSGDEPGRWAMLVPPASRVWPIGRVYRYFQLGERERDLVAFYVELEGQYSK